MNAGPDTLTGRTAKATRSHAPTIAGEKHERPHHENEKEKQP